MVNFTATIKGCNNLPITNGYISLSLANGTSTIAYTNANGAVNFSLIYCGGTVAYTYNVVDLSTGNYSSTASGTATTNTVNLGTLTACGNTINTSGVYIAGVVDNNAVLWKDGVPTFLTSFPASNYKYAYAARTLVYNNDIYVMGNSQDSTVNGWVSTIVVWKNGIATNLTSGTTDAEGFGLDVYNGDVYVCGTEAIGSQSVGKIWKNGVASTLAKDTFDTAGPTNVKVVNGDVYISGQVYKNTGAPFPISRAVYWKNGVLNILSGTTSSSGSADGLFINNTDLYFTGSEVNTGQASTNVLWKNGIKSVLAFNAPYTDTYSSAIFVDNTDVYVAGSASMHNQGTYYENATYWKNNTINLLTNSNISGYAAQVYDVFVKNNIVYTVGDAYGTNGSGTSSPLYFQNNLPVPLSGFTGSQDVSCYSIFVK